MSKATLAELFIDHSKSDRNAIHLYVSNPTPLEQKNLGKIFAFLNFDTAYPFSQEIAEYIDETFTTSYYHSSDFDIEAAFERSLQRVNKTVQELVMKYGESWVYHTSGILGVLYNNQVHLTYIGAVEAFMIQGNNITDILQKDVNAELKPLKLFTNIISGTCPEQAGMMFCTSNLLDYLSKDKIRRTVKDHSTADAIQNFESILTAQTTLLNIVGLIIKVEPGEPTAFRSSVIAPSETDTIETLASATPEVETTSPLASHDSMRQLVHQERATSDLLTPSIWPSLKKQLQDLTAKRSMIPDSAETNEDRYDSSLSSPTQQQRIQTGPSVWKLLGAWLVQFGKILYQLGIQLVLGIGRLGQWLMQQWQNRNRNSYQLRHPVRGTQNWWQRLAFPRKVLLVVFGCVILIFFVSLATKHKSVQQQQQTDTSAKTMAQVNNLLGEAQSKEIIPDQPGARAALAQAEQLLKTIPTASATFQQQGTTVQTKIDSLNNTLNNITALNNLTPLASFTTASPTAQVTNLTKIGDTLYGFDSKTQTIYNITTEGTTGIAVNNSSTTAYKTVKNNTATTSLALLTNNSFIELNSATKKTTPITTGSLPANTAVVSINVFGSRLYVLDPVTKQIYRAQKSGATYGAFTPWLKDATVDLSNATSFDIDSSIYVLLQTGQIVKLDSGTKSTFNLETFSPSLAGATKLLKPGSTSNIYVLNPKTNRIVVLTPDGKLKQQYTSSQFTQLTDMAVDENNKVIYVLSGQNIYKVPLQ